MLECMLPMRCTHARTNAHTHAPSAVSGRSAVACSVHAGSSSAAAAAVGLSLRSRRPTWGTSRRFSTSGAMNLRAPEACAHQHVPWQACGLPGGARL